ncbi:MAG: ATP/GTP-binding protein [Rhodocyclaceae bacterium]|nr:ATP/GTP-binding protein [Rhodocyclaceae bacterium]
MHKSSEAHKVLFVGPVGAGKTTAVAALSDRDIIRTDARVSDMTRFRKAETTVALDYGTTLLAGEVRVHLYGAPGQQRFDFMWEILQQGVTGLAILVDNSRRAPLDDLAFYLAWSESLAAKTRLAVGVSFMDKSQQPTLEEYQQFLRTRGVGAPVFPVDARRREDVLRLVKALVL